MEKICKSEQMLLSTQPTKTYNLKCKWFMRIFGIILVLALLTSYYRLNNAKEKYPDNNEHLMDAIDNVNKQGSVVSNGFAKDNDNGNGSGNDKIIDTMDEKKHTKSLLSNWYQPKNTSKTYKCPKVYLYKNMLREPFSDLPYDIATVDPEYIFGKKFTSIHFNTSSLAQSEILLYRIFHSKKCRTENPKKADLFYIPYLPARKKIGFWKSVSGNLTITESDLLKELMYLNKDTAGKHFFSVAKSYGASIAPGYFRPQSNLLKMVLRISQSMPLEKKKKKGIFAANFSKYVNKMLTEKEIRRAYWNAITKPGTKISWTTPGRTIFPYSTSIHWSERHPPTFRMNRTNLISYIHGERAHGDIPVRQRIRRVCYDHRGKRRHRRSIMFCTQYYPEAIKRKSNTIFCLEPGGDTPQRKSIIDSIAAGCIPVFFGDIVPEHYYQYYFGDEGKDAVLIINRTEFTTGKLRLIRYLANITKEEIRRKQKILFEMAPRFTFNLDDSMEDGFSTTLNKLVKVGKSEFPMYGDVYYKDLVKEVEDRNQKVGKRNVEENDNDNDNANDNDGDDVEDGDDDDDDDDDGY